MARPQLSRVAHLLRPGDLLVFNNTKVFPARLLGRRRGLTAQQVGKNNPAQKGFLTGETELFLTRHEGEDIWQGLVHPGRKVRTGEVLVFGDDELEAEILGRGEFGMRRARLRAHTGTVEDALDRLGHVPLPPYIQRKDEATDRTTYQTVYAKVRGAVAAPTAGCTLRKRCLANLPRAESRRAKSRCTSDSELFSRCVSKTSRSTGWKASGTSSRSPPQRRSIARSTRGGASSRWERRRSERWRPSRKRMMVASRRTRENHIFSSSPDFSFASSAAC